MLGTGILNSIQNHGLEKTTNDTYKFTAVAEPLGALMKADLKGNNIDRHLINIDKVVNVEILRNYNGMEALFYRDGLRKNYSNDDYNNFIKSYVYLSLNNLDTFIANRLEFFAEASGFNETPNSMILNSSELFKLVPPYDQNPLYSEFINEPFNKPIFSKLRENVIKILELRRIDNYYVTTPLYHFFYNVLPSLLLLICFVLYYLFKKEWGLACLLTLILGTFPLILFTAPAPYFMYYIPLLLCGYSYAVFFMIMLRRKTV